MTYINPVKIIIQHLFELKLIPLKACSKTESGRKCQKWNASSPNEPNNQMVKQVIKLTGSSNHNMCAVAHVKARETFPALVRFGLCTDRFHFIDPWWKIQKLGATQPIQTYDGNIVVRYVQLNPKCQRNVHSQHSILTLPVPVSETFRNKNHKLIEDQSTTETEIVWRIAN